jgi:hypothetical protein
MLAGALHRQRVECAELDLAVVFAAMQGIEVGHAVDARDDGLAVEHELRQPVLQRGLGDQE